MTNIIQHMKLTDVINRINIEDPKAFFDFTQKWIGYVISKKQSTDIPEDDWNKFFSRSNPVAGINRGEMLDKAATSTGVKITNERESFRNNWDSVIQPKIREVMDTVDENQKVSKIKDLKQIILNIIVGGGGRRMNVAINRIIVTFFPDLFISIPNEANLNEFIDLLNSKIENGSTIKRTGDWIDDCYQVRRFFNQELNSDVSLIVSAWRVYDELLDQSPEKFKQLKISVENKLKTDNVLQASLSGDYFIWVGTTDGRIQSDDCHYELCWDGDAKAKHEVNKVYVELHCERSRTAKHFMHLKEIDGVFDFPWSGRNRLGLRLNNDGWDISDYSPDDLADILIEELHKLHEAIGTRVMDIEAGLNSRPENSTKEQDYAEYIALLKDVRNLVLTGAPGTGKTYMAQHIAKAITDRIQFVQFHPSYDYTDFVEGLRPVEKKDGSIGFERKDGAFKSFCRDAINYQFQDTFEFRYEKLVKTILNQPNKEYKCSTYSSEDNVFSVFFENNEITFKRRDIEHRRTAYKERLKLLYDYYIAKGIFDVRKANREEMEAVVGTSIDYSHYRGILQTLLDIQDSQEINKPFVFIIDEINRGEASKIFGELFFAIDPGYRGKTNILVQTQYQNLVPETDVFAKGFYVPENVYILATMNDIDRSVESMDFAMRRRFTWHEITPDDTENMLDDLLCAKEAKETMHRLNKAIAKTDGLGAAYMIGPAYFLKLKDNGGDFEKLWKMNIQPLLKEYLRGFRKTNEILEKFHKAYIGESNESATGSPLLEDED